KTSIFSHPVYLFLREFSLQDFRGGSLLGMVIFLFTVSCGTLWYLGGMIQANLEDIRKQEETLQKLNAKTWGVEFVQDGNRKFLVLPYGKSAEVIPHQGKDWVQLME
ncbi:UNVERIFIED_CONTAM: hypothetical protein PO317_25715, partial [Escherichia coli]